MYYFLQISVTHFKSCLYLQNIISLFLLILYKEKPVSTEHALTQYFASQKTDIRPTNLAKLILVLDGKM